MTAINDTGTSTKTNVSFFNTIPIMEADLDYGEGWGDVSDAERYTEATVLAVICIVSTAANASLSLVVLGNRTLRNRPSLLLLMSLTLADLMVSVVSMPITLVTIVIGRWALSERACRVLGFLNMLTLVCSVMSLGLISVDRYIKICHTRHYHRFFTNTRVFVMALGVWIFSALLSSPPLMGWSRYGFLPQQSFCFCDWPSSVSYTIFMVVACFCGPLSMMTVCGVSILRKFRQCRSRFRGFNKTPGRSSDNNTSTSFPSSIREVSSIPPPIVTTLEPGGDAAVSAEVQQRHRQSSRLQGRDCDARVALRLCESPQTRGDCRIPATERTSCGQEDGPGSPDLPSQRASTEPLVPSVLGLAHGTDLFFTVDTSSTPPQCPVRQEEFDCAVQEASSSGHLAELHWGGLGLSSPGSNEIEVRSAGPVPPALETVPRRSSTLVSFPKHGSPPGQRDHESFKQRNLSASVKGDNGAQQYVPPTSLAYGSHASWHVASQVTQIGECVSVSSPVAETDGGYSRDISPILVEKGAVTSRQHRPHALLKMDDVSSCQRTSVSAGGESCNFDFPLPPQSQSRHFASSNSSNSEGRSRATLLPSTEQQQQQQQNPEGDSDIRTPTSLLSRKKPQSTLSSAQILEREKKEKQRAEEFQLAFSLFLAVIIFVVCWLPFCVTIFLSIFAPHYLPRAADMFTLLLGYSNSCINPVIYGVRNQFIKKGYMALFRSLGNCCRARFVYNTASDSRT